MASSKKKRVRLSMDVCFTCEAEKDAFCATMGAIRDRLTHRGSRTLNNYEFLTALFELVPSNPTSSDATPSRGSFLRNYGKF